MGQGGNVAEWMETSATGSNTVPYADRSFNGAAVNDQSQQLQADNRTAFNVNPAFESPYIGFRVASAAIGTGSAGVSQTVGRHRPGNGRPSGKPSKPRTGVGGINPTPTTGAGTSIVGTAIVPQG